MSGCTRDSGLGIKLLSVILCYVDLTQYVFCTVNILIVKTDNTVRGCRQVFAEPRKFLVFSHVFTHCHLGLGWFVYFFHRAYAVAGGEPAFFPNRDFVCRKLFVSILNIHG